MTCLFFFGEKGLVVIGDASIITGRVFGFGKAAGNAEFRVPDTKALTEAEEDIEAVAEVDATEEVLERDL